MSNSAQTSASSRIHMLLDENSFVEVGAYVTARSTDFNMTDKETPADGVVTGYGTIDGCLVYVYSQDAAVLGGSMGEMHAKKISNIYDMAYQSEMAGTVDFTGDEAEVIGAIRSLVSVLPSNNEEDMSYAPCEDDLNRVCEGLENCVEDTGMALASISDGGFFMEMKKDYAPSMVTGFIRLNGSTVGCVANRSAVYGEDGEKAAEYAPVLGAKGCRKAAEFVNFCDAFNIPLLTLVNVTGYKADKCNEKTLAQSAAKLTYAFANASVPKVTVIIGQAYGTAYLTMASKSIGADIVYAWPDAVIGMMDATAAAKIMYADEIRLSDDAPGLIREKAAQYRQIQSSAMAAAKRGYVDDIIEAKDTRKRVIAALEMLFTKREDRPSKKHGTV